MEKIQNGKYVELGYDLYEVAADGSQKLVHQTDIEDPEKFVYGVTEGMIEPLERAVEGLEVGGTFDIIVKCDDAFGPHDPDQVAELDRDIFVVDGKFDDKKIKPGAIVPMMTADGYRINGLVTAVSLTHVTMDFNHPLLCVMLLPKTSLQCIAVVAVATVIVVMVVAMTAVAIATEAITTIAVVATAINFTSKIHNNPRD